MEENDYNTCEGYMLSACCGAPLICEDLCSECKEHTDCQCTGCDDADKCDNFKETI